MKPRVRVKICGITTRNDLNAAVAAGADAIGLIVGTTHFSEDELAIPQAMEIASAAPIWVTPVLVTHLVDPDAIIDLAGTLGVHTIQAHGKLSGEAARQLWRRRGNCRILRTVHVTDEHCLEEARAASAHTDGVLLDSRTETRLGGTGLTHDWTISRRIVELIHPQPVVLAGGLGPDNVTEAVRTVRPFGVDANSRLKDGDGGKEPAVCAAFVAAANRQ